MNILPKILDIAGNDLLTLRKLAPSLEEISGIKVSQTDYINLQTERSYSSSKYKTNFMQSFPYGRNF